MSNTSITPFTFEGHDIRFTEDEARVALDRRAIQELAKQISEADTTPHEETCTEALFMLLGLGQK